MEIKFRGKTITEKKWITGHYFTKKLCDGRPRHHYIKNDGDDGIEIDPETLGRLLHIDERGQNYYTGDIALLKIHVPDKGSDFLGNIEEGFDGYAVGTVNMHIRHGLCIGNYRLYDIDNNIVSTGKAKTITLSRSTIIGNVWDSPGILLRPYTK